MNLVLEQILNGLQFGVMLFLMAAGLTLIFGIMNLINLAHGSLYMIGAYAGATATQYSQSFAIGFFCALLASGVCGMLIEIGILRRLYRRNHLDQVLATFALILFFNESIRVIWGRQPLFLDIPAALSFTVELIPGAPYPMYRLMIILVGIAVAVFLYVLIQHTRLGMLIRAGASNREMICALGVNINLLYTLVFGLGAMLAGMAGFLAGPILAVEPGMGENILILTFVVVVIGGIGSVKGAFAGALIVGLVDTLGRAFLPDVFRLFLDDAAADTGGASIAAISIYLLMAIVLVARPHGLFPPKSTGGTGH